MAAVLRAHDWLTVHDAAALADARLVVAPDVVEDRHHTPVADVLAEVLPVVRGLVLDGFLRLE